MTVGASIFLIAVGAILKYATNLHVKGLSIDTVGLILMLAGIAGLVLGLIQYAMASNRRRREIRIEDNRRPVGGEPPVGRY